jgi:hypothetical protein
MFREKSNQSTVHMITTTSNKRFDASATHYKFRHAGTEYGKI